MTTKSLIRAVLAPVLAVALAAGLTAGPAAAASSRSTRSHSHPSVTVMTRNLYLGADINRPINAARAAAAAGLPPAQIVGALANATHETRAIVDRTNFPVRSRLLAREIEQTRPDLVGLQEVAWWRHGPLQLDQIGVPNATETDYDFLTILLRALAALHQHYVPVVVGSRADVESPSFTGAGSADAQDVRLTMRDVILLRQGSGLRVTGTHDQVYATNIALGVAGVTFRFDRGFQWVDVRRGRTSFRFVNTHLESASSDYALAQATELVASAPAAGRTTVLVCDCNSDPLNHSVKTGIGDTVPHSAPYDLITQTLSDEWLRWRPAELGWTSGLSETVDDPDASGFDHRIDMVFARTGSGRPLRVVGGLVTGTSTADRDPATGLWPSDHGGVVLRLSGL